MTPCEHQREVQEDYEWSSGSSRRAGMVESQRAASPSGVPSLTQRGPGETTDKGLLHTLQTENATVFLLSPVLPQGKKEKKDHSPFTSSVGSPSTSPHDHSVAYALLGVLDGPLSRDSLSILLVLFPVSRDVVRERIVLVPRGANEDIVRNLVGELATKSGPVGKTSPHRIRSREERLDRQEHGTNLERGRPLVFENVETDATQLVCRRLPPRHGLPCQPSESEAQCDRERERGND